MIRSAVLLACLAGALVVPAMTAPPVAAETPGLRLAQAGAIQAPSTVDPGASISVTLPGGDADGRIELWGPVTETGRGERLDSVPAADAVALMAPVRPGSYELRYVGPDGAVRARRSLDVAAVPVTLEVPEQLSAGLDTKVRWRGPGNPGDMLQIVDPASGMVLSEAPAVAAAPGDKTETVLRAPERLGDYRLRYWSAPRDTVLRSLPVKVVKGNAWLRAPLTVHRGAPFEVQWYGPISDDQAFRIVDPLTDTVVKSYPAADKATLAAPSRTGNYRIRYVNTETGHLLADLPLRVTPD